MEKRYVAYLVEDGHLDVVTFDDPKTRADWIGAGYIVPDKMTFTEYWYSDERHVTNTYLDQD